MSEVRRLFVGGLVENITDKEICERFSRFGDVTDVDIRSKNELLSGEKKVFAYINLKTTDEKLNKCIKIYNNSKWKGKQLQVQLAKENFLQRLQKERHVNLEDEEKEKRKLHSDDHSKIKDTVIKATPQGTPVDNMRNWVVAKQGKILPVMYIRRKDKKKVIKVDPSKYIHRNKTLDDERGSSGIDPSDIPVDSLTWWQDEKPQKSASENMNGSKNKLTKTQLCSQLNIDYRDAGKRGISNSDVQRSGYFKNKATTHSMKQDSGTVSFYSDSDCDEVEQVSAPACCSSSEDTDEMLSKMKINNKHVKSQSKIKLERTQAQSKKTKTEPMDNRPSDDTSEGSDSIADGHVGSLPKWLESESESDMDCQNTAIRQQSDNMTATNHLNYPSTKKIRTNSVKEQKPVRQPVAVDRHAGNSPKIQTTDDTKQNDNLRKGFMSETAIHIEYIPRILDEYSSGFQEQHSDNNSNDDDGDDEGDELDVFDMIQSGKINKLYKQDFPPSKTKKTGAGQTAENQLIKAGDLKTTKQFKKSVLDPPTERSELDKSQQDKKSADIGRNNLGEITGIRSIGIQHAAEEMKQLKRKINDTPTESKSDNERNNKKMKVLCTAELAAKVNEKRLCSLKERLMAAQQQKAIVKKALAVVDSQQQTSKKIVFDSDEEEAMQVHKDQATAPDDQDDQSQSDLEQIETVKKKAPMLFDSDSSESSEDENVTDNESDKERFNIRPEFEGRAGKKLLQLQSRYGNDSRFKLDSRFIESSSSSDTDSDNENTIQNKDGAASEKHRALEILRSLVGHKATEGRKKEKTFIDINTLHYDPASTTHSEFEIPVKKTKKKISKIRTEPEVEKEEEKEDKPDMPEVSTERFYEVKPSLKDLFSSKDNEDKPFSLAATFGHVNEDEVNEGQDDDTKENLSVHKNIVPWQNPLTDQDSSDEHDDEESKETVQDNKSSLGEHLAIDNTRNRNRFFLQLSDDDVQESLRFFTSPEDKSEMRAKWLEARPGLVEAYKMKRRRSLRETHLNQRFKANKHGRQR